MRNFNEKVTPAPGNEGVGFVEGNVNKLYNNFLKSRLEVLRKTVLVQHKNA